MFHLPHNIYDKTFSKANPQQAYRREELMGVLGGKKTSIEEIFVRIVITNNEMTLEML